MSLPTPPEESKLALIRKLLAQAEDRSASPAEAEAFTGRATDLMARYGVDQAMLAATGDVPDTIGEQIVWITNPYGQRKRDLLGQIAIACGCRIAYRSSGRGRIRVQLIGFPADRERTEMLFTSLLIQQARELARTPVPPGEGPVAFRNAWMYGYAVRIRFRLHEAHQRAGREYDEQTALPDRPGGRSAELVLADRRRRVDAHVDQQGFRTAGPTRLSGSGAARGARAADRADLGAAALNPATDHRETR